MQTERARCRRCGASIDFNQNLIFPKAGGVEHLNCAKTRKPLARVGGGRNDVGCLVCGQPLLALDNVVMVGHDLLHSDCRDRLRTIGGGSGPSARRLARAVIKDPFACAELVAASAVIRLDAADVCAMSLYLRNQRARERRSSRAAS
jgi:hypothetical protein